MEAGDSSNKSLEEIQKEKIQAEINLINAKIRKVYPESRPMSRFGKVAEFFKQWYAVILALIAVFGGFWGIFAPVKSYFNERNKAVQYELNANMIDAMGKLDSADMNLQGNAIMVLSYYDLNAIPIFLDKLVKTDPGDTYLQQKYIEAIKLIYKRKRADIVDKITSKMDYSFQQVSRDPYLIYSLWNLSFLVEWLEPVRTDRRKVTDLYKNMIDKLNADSTLMEIDGMPKFRADITRFIEKN
jgi:hypothetical protein